MGPKAFGLKRLRAAGFWLPRCNAHACATQHALNEALMLPEIVHFGGKTSLPAGAHSRPDWASGELPGLSVHEGLESRAAEWHRQVRRGACDHAKQKSFHVSPGKFFGLDPALLPKHEIPMCL